MRRISPPPVPFRPPAVSPESPEAPGRPLAGRAANPQGGSRLGREESALTDAQALHEAICARCLAIEGDFLRLMDLLAEAHATKLWESLGYEDARRYFEGAVGLSYRTVTRLLSIHTAVLRVPEAEWPDLRKALAQIGTHKASVLAPLLGSDEHRDWRAWVGQAKALTEDALQARVSEATGAPRRGAAASDQEPGEKLLAAVLRFMPPEQQKRVEVVLRLTTAARTDSRNLIAGFLAMIDLAQADLGASGVEVRV